jgi:predicted AAA+ superfamily ATPase
MAYVIDRLIAPRLRASKKSVLLLGARQVGKSTLLQDLGPDLTINLASPSVYRDYVTHPERLEDELRAAPPSVRTVFIDEVQRLPALLNEVHRLIESRRIRFALTGSSARKLRRAGVNLLAGRAVTRTMFPLAPAELGDDFDLDRALRLGTLPLVWSAPEPEATLEAYALTYLKQEIQAEALARNLAGFARFLPIAALFHGQVLNTSGLARDAGVSRTTVHGYLEILVDTLVATLLPAFEAKLRVRERRHSKLYLVDPGIVRALGRSRGEPGPREALTVARGDRAERRSRRPRAAAREELGEVRRG